MNEMKRVSRDEFESFLAAYPKELERDVTRICEPPMISYNDFSDGKVFPESIVAKTWYGTDDYYINQA